MRIHQRYADRLYTHPDTGQPAGAGALQIVFCDRGTPSKHSGQFTIYQALKDELIDRGMPAEAIRFVHDAKTHEELKSLFSQCNSGEVSVLIGSTEKMGTGVNVQARAAALHHVDLPWRPCDLEQREGRILRQGNQNLDGIHIFNYVTESSYDTVMWQKVQAKALFIEQMHRNEVVDTEIEDLSGGDIGAAAAETKAIATGDPRYLRQVELDGTVKRLTALDRAHQQSVRNRDWQVHALEHAIPNKQRDIDALVPVAETAATHIAAGRPPHITVADMTYTDRVPAAQAISVVCQQAYTAGKDRGASRFEPIGATINGIDILAVRDLTHDQLLLRLAVPSRTTDIDALELLSISSGPGSEANGPKQLGLLRRVENLYSGLPEHHRRLQHERDRDQAALDDFLANPPAPFEHAAQLADKQAELNALTLELRMAAESPEAKAKAKAKAAAADQRMKARGRKPGWSLLLNPTSALLEEVGYPHADALRRVMRARERFSLEHHQLEQGVDDAGHEL